MQGKVFNMARIILIDDISKEMKIDENREQFDYCLEDLDEAIRNNKYLVYNLKDKRIYEITDEEYRKGYERIRVREKYKKNKEYIKEYNKKYNKEYYIKNKKMINEKRKKYVYENKEKIAEKQHKYYLEKTIPKRKMERAKRYLENIAKEKEAKYYEIVEDTYKYVNGLSLIIYEDENREYEQYFMCVNVDEF